MTKEIRDSFIFYRSFVEAGRDLPECERLAFYEAIFSLALEEKEAKLEGFSGTLFKLVKPNILANNKRFKDGKKGGRKPKKETSGYSEKETSGYEKNKPNKDVNNNNNKNVDGKSEIKIPDFIDQILFDEFLQQRKKDKNPIEGMALKLTIEDLEKWENKNKGNANLAVKNAIKGGWKSLVEPKPQSQNNGYNAQNQKSDYEKWKEANGK
jgi:hypothetical protein